MKASFTLRVCLGTCTLLIAAATLATATAQVEKGKSRPMLTEQFMEGSIKPHATGIKKGLEAGPSTDEAWKELAVHAAILNEGSYVLMEDGRCPDSVCANAATKTMRNGSESLIKAIDHKDLEAARKAFGELSKSCKECHEKHKKKH